MNEILAILASILTIYSVYVTLRARKKKTSYEIKIYKDSDDSDDDFYDDISKAKNVKFIGTTHSNLDDILKRASDKSTLILETIEIYYSNNNELTLMGKSSEDLTESLNSLSKIISHLYNSKSINLIANIFYLKQFPPFAGCLIDNRILYIVHYSPKKDNLESNGITLRIDSEIKSELTQKLFNQYRKSLDDLTVDSCFYTKIYPSIWDMSVMQWDEFETKCIGYQRNMDFLSSKLNDKCKILEIGCGTGKLANKIADTHKESKISISDFSGKMIDYCNRRFNSNKRISYRFFNPYETFNFDNKLFNIIDYDFDYVISHMSFPFPEDSKYEFMDLLFLLKNIIIQKGKFIISVHNTVIDIANDTYISEKDEFKNELINSFKRKFGKRCVRKVERTKYTKEEFISIVEDTAKVKYIEDEINVYSFSMAERILMWKVPAILNSLIECSQMGKDSIEIIFKELIKKFEKKNTEPLIINTFIFEKY